MTRQEAEYLYGWLENTYPRNYRDVDLRQKATTIDNLAKVFAHNTYKDVQAEYERVFANQKNEPHPSEIRKSIKAEVKKAVQAVDPYEVLRKHPMYAEIEHAYGARATRRAAKCCVEKCSIAELQFRLEHDTECTEKDYSDVIKQMRRGEMRAPYNA